MRHATVPRRLFEPLRAATGVLLSLVEGVAFWAAAVFPLVYVAAILLYDAGVVSETELVVLVALNAVSVLVGHQHRSQS
ncbi:hypothetical protein KY092_04735 [Natronomonas gomsonensis]|uniref:hypothetical protein n=1 Tax=Natronomonas gomsonensis TaxID=1046043 RepID=UPI0020CA33E3|nr:hypothetical protein [Natronomonas gomsonensis]MCY4729863.1 hypothetical protein [Natronomonas gomsonensis]